VYPVAFLPTLAPLGLELDAALGVLHRGGELAHARVARAAVAVEDVVRRVLGERVREVLGGLVELAGGELLVAELLVRPSRLLLLGGDLENVSGIICCLFFFGGGEEEEAASVMVREGRGGRRAEGGGRREERQCATDEMKKKTSSSLSSPSDVKKTWQSERLAAASIFFIGGGGWRAGKLKEESGARLTDARPPSSTRDIKRHTRE
jgi:hypothetical protein